MITLGIETSCDETALALIETRDFEGKFEYRVLASYIHSQADLHNQFGGVYPNLAKREHAKFLLPLLKKLLADTKGYFDGQMEQIPKDIFDKKIKDIEVKYSAKNSDLVQTFLNENEFLKNIPKIDRIAVTEGPGLEPALWVGISFALILNELWKIEVVPVNHMEGHVIGSLLHDEESDKWQSMKDFNGPGLALLISGGHTQIVELNRNNHEFNYKIIGETRDDAVGEAYDKVARILDLPYPGGPHVSRLADEAVDMKLDLGIALPRPMLNTSDLDFSFSGLKTAVLYAVRDEKSKNGDISIDFKRAIANEFENAVNEVLISKIKKSIEETQAKSLLIGGGVIANKRLRQSFTNLAHKYGMSIYLPSKHVSGDNALMIAISGALKIKVNKRELRADGTKSLAESV